MGMLACFSKRTMHLFGDRNPYADQAHLRYLAFKRFNWTVAFFDDEKWEEDEYDAPPSTLYFVYYNNEDEPLGCFRLAHTNLNFIMSGQMRSCMLKDVFDGSANKQHNLLYQGNDDHLFQDNMVREGTRFALAPYLLKREHQGTREHVVSELTLGMVEYALAHNIYEVVGVMPPKVWESVWGKRGCQPDWLGPELTLENGETVRAGSLKMSTNTLRAMRTNTGLYVSSLNTGRPVAAAVYAEPISIRSRNHQIASI